MAGANVRPLGEIGLAENNCSSLAQLLNNESIFCTARSKHRQRSRRGFHAIGGIDVVFNQDWNSVQRTARTLVFTFFICSLGHRERVCIQFEQAVDRRSLLVVRFYTSKILLCAITDRVIAYG